MLGIISYLLTTSYIHSEVRKKNSPDYEGREKTLEESRKLKEAIKADEEERANSYKGEYTDEDVINTIKSFEKRDIPYPTL